jgi:serine/threonine-protein kinase SRPK3
VERMKESTQNPSSPLFRALKIQKSAPNYTEAAIDEIELLKDVAKQRYMCEKSSTDVDRSGIPMQQTIEHSKHVAALHDAFMHSGPNGEHACMVFSILNWNLLSIIKAYNFEGIPIPTVKHIMRGVCMGLDFLHRRCQIIHTDLKPENVMLDFPSESNSPLIKQLSTKSFLSSPTNDSRSGRSSLESSSLSPSSIPVLESISVDTPSNSKRDLRDTELLERSRVVVVDLGSACWVDEHFSDDIQTRQYRSPEVLIGAP